MNTAEKYEQLVSTQEGINTLFDATIQKYGKKDMLDMLLFDVPREDLEELLNIADIKA